MNRDKTEREKIVEVLGHAIEQGSKVKYVGVRFYKVHESTVSEFESELRKEIAVKIELFKKVDEKSHTYRIIFCNAKIALDYLRDGHFEVRSAELINLFLNIQTVFRNNLEFTECKELEDKMKDNRDLKEKEVKIQETEKEIEDRLKILKRKHRDIKYLEEGVTAKKKKKKEIEDIEQEEAFSEANTLDFDSDGEVPDSTEIDINELEFE